MPAASCWFVGEENEICVAAPPTISASVPSKTPERSSVIVALTNTDAGPSVMSTVDGARVGVPTSFGGVVSDAAAAPGPSRNASKATADNAANLLNLTAPHPSAGHPPP